MRYIDTTKKLLEQLREFLVQVRGSFWSRLDLLGQWEDWKVQDNNNVTVTLLYGLSDVGHGKEGK
ncbi:hypothetical protein PAXRUDRAFT_829238 [Paxillus rubicundulus Ve08.2h10]|uniref:Uncharacterized protein n=1 Tax=Paxillus rubicundulus Ve08.2h10 TaxID=930991 RepID=A0A0D0DV06_9AGAM|nr:hypothetical protein PAXRUDRAFT_829238 [Paxillus rubicundulus Ve08.2h10]